MSLTSTAPGAITRFLNPPSHASAPAIEQGDVDPAIFASFLKIDHTCFVEEIGIEDHCAVGTLGQLAAEAAMVEGLVYGNANVRLTSVLCG
jgi:hypothetical protein